MGWFDETLEKVSKIAENIVAPITQPMESLFGVDKKRQRASAKIAETKQAAEFKAQEKAKYQAMVDAVYGGQARQKKLAPGRPGSIYSSQSQGGIFNI